MAARLLIATLIASGLVVLSPPLLATADNALPYYYLPWDSGVQHNVWQGNNCCAPDWSHTGLYLYAWDFGGGGWTVRAARSGTVVGARDNSQTGGCNPSYEGTENYVTVSSSGNTSATYVHLAYGSISGQGITINQAVDLYTALGITDSTGYACGAHLHYQVQSGCSGICQSVQSSFLDPDVLRQNPSSGVPQTSQNVVSANHPIGAPPNLLQNASFEDTSSPCSRGNWGWFAGSGATVAYCAYNDITAMEGQQYMEMNVNVPNSGSGIYQHVYTAPQVAQSYTFSAWLRLRPNDPGTSIRGKLVLWGLYAIGNLSSNQGSTTFNVDKSWRLISAPLNVTVAGLNLMDAVIYLDDANENLDVDGAQVVNAGLQNASFEDTSTPCSRGNWGSFAGSGATVAYCAYNNSTAIEGQQYMEMNVNVAYSSSGIYQHVNTAPQVAQSYTFSAWLRLSPNDPASSIRGKLVLWGLYAIGSPSSNQGSTTFNVDKSWTMVSAPLDVTVAGLNLMDAIIYLDDANENLDVDGAQVTNAGLTNASLEVQSAPLSWGPFGTGTVAAVRQGSQPTTFEGSYYIEFSTTNANAGISQPLSFAPRAGQSYTLTVWVKCNCPLFSYVSGTVQLWNLGGTPMNTPTSFTVYGFQGWSRVSAPMNPTATGTDSSVSIYTNTGGLNLDVDGATLSSGNR